jgi:kynurenine formamidase
MRWFCALLCSILLILALREKSEFPQGRIVDLSHSFDAETIYWPTEDGFRLENEHAGPTDKGYYYASNKFCAPEHGGTHIDAPIHFAEGHQTVDQIPLEQLTGAAILVDVGKQCEANRDYQITTEDLQAWEKKNGTIPRGSIVLLRTGFGRRWPNRQSYLGTDGRGAGAVAKLHFPGLHPEAARWLTTSRSIKAVGLDTASIDYGQSTLFESHRTLFEKNVPAFENLANLDQLPAKDFLIIALPMKIKGGSGGPLRVIAIVK